MLAFRLSRLLRGHRSPPLALCRALGTASPSASSARHGGKPFYITTPIYYVNGAPHIGHAYTSIATDILARYHRLLGQKVFFLTGTDEHGQKVQQSASAAGQTPLDFCNVMSGKFQALSQALDVSADGFIRTTAPAHKRAVQHLWTTLAANGAIYKGSYAGWYSVRDEAYYTAEELVDGRAPTGAEVQWLTEESYFFRLSQYTDKLIAHYTEACPESIQPKVRLHEVLAFLQQEGGLRDLSISRTAFTWGIPVPGDSKHVIYVWLDALANYLTVTGYGREGAAASDSTSTTTLQQQPVWPADLHIVGKDILRFHAIYWPAFLLAAGLPLPKRIFAHGWWTKDGEKMSKSLGNVVEPMELVDKYGVDYVRYFLCSEMLFGSDGNYSQESFEHTINVSLANNLGNLIQRVVGMINKHFASAVPHPGPLTAADEELLQQARSSQSQIIRFLESQSLKQIVDEIEMLSAVGNRYINSEAPWHAIKGDQGPERCGTVLFCLIELLRIETIYLSPILPRSTAKMMELLGIAEAFRTWESVQQTMPSGGKVGEAVPIFPRIEIPKTENAKAAEQARPQSTPSPATSKPKPVPDAGLVSKYAAYSKQEVERAIEEVGNKVRALKAEGSAKEVFLPWVQELQYLKQKLGEMGR